MTKEYVVVMCPKCKRAQIASGEQKTRQCSYRGETIQLASAQVFLRTSNIDEARTFLGKTKRRRMM